MNVQTLKASFNGPNTCNLHGDKSRLHGEYLKASHCMALSMSWSLCVLHVDGHYHAAGWCHQWVYPDVILHLHKQHLKWLWVSYAYELQQVDILLLQEIVSPPSGPVWMNSPASTPPCICAVKLSAKATHPVNTTVLHECLPVRLLSQMDGCAIYTATAVLWTGFSWTCLVLDSY
jgi:hypothetical protein